MEIFPYKKINGKMEIFPYMEVYPDKMNGTHHIMCYALTLLLSDMAPRQDII